MNLLVKKADTACIARNLITPESKSTTPADRGPTSLYTENMSYRFQTGAECPKIKVPVEKHEGWARDILFDRASERGVSKAASCTWGARFNTGA